LAAQQRLCCSSLRCSGSSKTSSVSCLPCLRCSRSQRARQPPPRCAAANKNSSVTEIQSDIHRVKLSIATLTNDKVAADDSVQKAMAEVCVCHRVFHRPCTHLLVQANSDAHLLTYCTLYAVAAPFFAARS
jgi:hypothetical protein